MCNLYQRTLYQRMLVGALALAVVAMEAYEAVLKGSRTC
jgi:hypothetical protein